MIRSLELGSTPKTNVKEYHSATNKNSPLTIIIIVIIIIIIIIIIIMIIIIK